MASVTVPGPNGTIITETYSSSSDGTATIAALLTQAVQSRESGGGFNQTLTAGSTEDRTIGVAPGTVESADTINAEGSGTINAGFSGGGRWGWHLKSRLHGQGGGGGRLRHRHRNGRRDLHRQHRQRWCRHLRDRRWRHERRLQRLFGSVHDFRQPSPRSLRPWHWRYLSDCGYRSSLHLARGCGRHRLRRGRQSDYRR